MKLIEPKVELIEQAPGLVGMYKHIEKCSRTCYKSEDKITEDSYKKIYNNLVQRGHLAMLEHGTVYLKFPYNDNCNYYAKILEKYVFNPYSKIADKYAYVTTNLRVIVENHWEDDLKYICEPTEFHERRITLKFITNIGVTREGNRHRVNSIAEESTRYCNYNLDKFDKSITFCLPTWINKNATEIQACRTAEVQSDMLADMRVNMDLSDNWNTIDWYLYALSTSALAYKNLIKLGCKPQQAREVLPLATKSEVVYTAFASDWKHWFDLRLVGTTGKPHPNMEQVTRLAQQELIKNNLWKLIYHDNKHD